MTNYMYQGLNGAVVGKVPGQLRGEDFIIEDCKVLMDSPGWKYIKAGPGLWWS